MPCSLDLKDNGTTSTPKLWKKVNASSISCLGAFPYSPNKKERRMQKKNEKLKRNRLLPRYASDY